MEKYKKRIQDRKEKGLFRTLSSSNTDFIDFYSNDYLGLSEKEIDSDSEYKSATGSRLISGNSIIYNKAELLLAEFFESPSSLLFNSGYDANIGLFSSLPQKGDTILYDELIHASIRDGIRLSNANSYKFQHNSLEDLELKIQKATGEIFIAVESVYSMDGDFSPLLEINELAKKHKAKLLVDEAHSAGVFGAGGRGVCVKLGIQDDVFARVVTFGKAYGSHGAVVLGDADLKDYLINFARSFIYTTGLPNLAIERIMDVVSEGKYLEEERKKLFKNVEFFKSLIASSSHYQIASASAIQTLIFPGNGAAKNIEAKLLSEKINCKAILSPTVPEGKERLRVSIHSFNTEEEISRLVSIITKYS